ncbi:tetratricopeptide repeat protein [Micromonospora sp. RP3T]|uniref:tetratricopeptide repeat protein n=1 Tax=Micromonospora sp. RP3T TaxID=2135446 RepID=UPI001304E049|nr:tetratricopeptide repeat protein [Micromonospora sp. RP3T]
MPRPERPLNPERDPLHAFAARLRHLRTAAGNPTYAAMARRSGRSQTALAGAASGTQLPTWDTVTAYVTCCGGDPDDFLSTWEHLRDLRDGTALPEPATRTDPVSGLANLPRPPVPIFCGRDTELAFLRAHLHPEPASDGSSLGIVLHGLGGVGKTELALQFTHTARDRFTLTWWITADTGDNLAAGLAALTRALNPGWPATAGVSDAADWATQWLASHADWLVVLDNVNDLATIETLAAAAKDGRILVTSRRDVDWVALRLTSLPLGPLTRPASVDLLRRWSGRTAEPADATGLASDMGDLPLALRQAAAYLLERPTVSLADYRARLARRPLRVLETHNRLYGYDHPVARTWHVTVETLTDEDPSAGRLLDLVAYLAPDEISLDLLHTPDTDPWDVEDTIALVASYSMVSRKASGIAVHRLVQTMTRASHTGPEHALAAATAIIAATPDGDPETSVPGWRQWSRLTPHIEALAEHLTTIDALRQDTGLLLTAAALFDRCAIYHRGQGRYRTAVYLFEQSLAIRDCHLGPEHPDTLTSWYGLGGGYWSIGRYAECLGIGEATLAARRRILGVEHPDTLQNASNIAVGYREMGRHEEAIALSEETLAVRRRVLGPDHPDTLQSCNNLAGCYRAVGRHAEAITLYERTLTARRRTLGDDHPDTLQSCNNLAGGYQAVGQHVDAIALHESTLAIRTRILGPEHPDTLHSMSNLAVAYEAVGRISEAATLHQATLDGREKTLGPQHPDTRRAARRLAVLRHGAAAVDQRTG